MEVRRIAVIGKRLPTSFQNRGFQDYAEPFPVHRKKELIVEIRAISFTRTYTAT